MKNDGRAAAEFRSRPAVKRLEKLTHSGLSTHAEPC